jgi:glutamate/tyrosine decarboxylase-like PLP-dependent enzyme
MPVSHADRVDTTTSNGTLAPPLNNASPESALREAPMHEAPLREAPLRMSPDEFREVGFALVNAAADFLGGVRERPVTPGESPREVQATLGSSNTLPEFGRDAGELLNHATGLLFDHSLLNGHPRFWGYITASPAPIGMLADLLASVVNANVGAWRLAPMATELEAQTVRWIAELVGYPVNGGGLLVSGGNLANIVGLFAARAAASRWDVRSQGVGAAGAPALRVYASAETHTWLHKATDLSGLGTNAIHWIPTDAAYRLDPAALREAILADRAQGQLPMMVVATAGTVSSGAIDPIREIATVCEELGVWLHIDGAYGALAACVDGVSEDLAALGRADSLAVDPHKWLYAPLEAGCLLVRDAARLRDAFAYHPPYYHFGQEAINYFDLGPQNSRGFRALKLWLALQQVGRRGYERMIHDDMLLSERLFKRLEEHPEFEACTQSLSISTFRFVPDDLRGSTHTAEVAQYLNTLNEALLERVQQAGEFFFSNAVLDGRYLLRACIVNFNTEAFDVDALPEAVAREGRTIDAVLRAEPGDRPAPRKRA